MLKLCEIKEIMRRPEIKMSGIATAIGVEYWRVRNALVGNRPNYEILEKISDYLETNIKVGGEK